MLALFPLSLANDKASNLPTDHTKAGKDTLNAARRLTKVLLFLPSPHPSRPTCVPLPLLSRARVVPVHISSSREAVTQAAEFLRPMYDAESMARITSPLPFSLSSRHVLYLRKAHQQQ